MRTILLILFVLSQEILLAESTGWSISSPDGKSILSVALDETGALSYQAARGDKPVVLKSPLGLRRDDESFEKGLVLRRAAGVEKHREVYELFAGANPHIDHELRSRSLTFCNTNRALLIVDLAASDEGVAFRYRFPEKGRKVRMLRQELTGFTVPMDAKGWLQPYHAAGPYTPAYEDFYFKVSPEVPPPDSRAKAVGWAFPALFHVPEAGTWALVTESGTDESYCACHLAPDSRGGLYRIAFPLPDEHTSGITNQIGPEPRYQLPWTMPWRVIEMADTACEIATDTLVTDLAQPSKIKKTAWIHPGRVSWMWWSYPEGSNTVSDFNHFTDFAARMGWEYTLFDAGWWTPGIKPIARYAEAKGVAPLAWLFAGDFYGPTKTREAFDKVESAGVRGVKVDFWCSDRQEAMAAMQNLFKEAAARKMVVDLHGCTIPRGWQRTWPNYLTAEAVLGAECYFFEPKFTEKAAELNTVLPFTRNAVGPMDSTPVACSPQKYERTTTAAHELATALVFTSGLIHFADKPEFFESLPPEALQILKDAPARWDETRCLVGEPGRVAVFARRSGKTWFIAGINGSGEPVSVDLNLADFNQYSKRLMVTEGADAKMTVAVTSLAPAVQWQHSIPARGGFILRMDRN